MLNKRRTVQPMVNHYFPTRGSGRRHPFVHLLQVAVRCGNHFFKIVIDGSQALDQIFHMVRVHTGSQFGNEVRLIKKIGQQVDLRRFDWIRLQM